jgi:similar to spore coat protein
MGIERLALHETLELHEILTFKNICCTKSATMQGLVSDPELKSILQLDCEMSKKHIQELSNLLSRSNLQ